VIILSIVPVFTKLGLAGELTMSSIRVLGLLLALWPATALAAGGGEGGGLISLDRSLIIQAINFAILLFLLTRVLYRPIVGKLEERSEAIRKSLEEAQEARSQATRERQEHAAKLQAAHGEAQAIRAQALREAQEEQRKLVEAARAEAARLEESARAELDQDVRRAREALRQEVADLAVGVAERLVRKSLRDEDHRRIVEDAIARVGRGN
jgi:F-type H+-transporting ATPase subunit b